MIILVAECVCQSLGDKTTLVAYQVPGEVDPWPAVPDLMCDPVLDYVPVQLATGRQGDLTVVLRLPDDPISLPGLQAVISIVPSALRQGGPRTHSSFSYVGAERIHLSVRSTKQSADCLARDAALLLDSLLRWFERNHAALYAYQEKADATRPVGERVRDDGGAGAEGLSEPSLASGEVGARPVRDRPERQAGDSTRSVLLEREGVYRVRQADKEIRRDGTAEAQIEEPTSEGTIEAERWDPPKGLRIATAATGAVRVILGVLVRRDEFFLSREGAFPTCINGHIPAPSTQRYCPEDGHPFLRKSTESLLPLGEHFAKEFDIRKKLVSWTDPQTRRTLEATTWFHGTSNALGELHDYAIVGQQIDTSCSLAAGRLYAELQAFDPVGPVTMYSHVMNVLMELKLYAGRTVRVFLLPS